MKTWSLILSIALVVVATDACHDVGSTPSQITGIEGQVYSIATPGPIPVNWVPPPLEQISTVVVLDSNHKSVLELLTNNKGRFSVELKPGTYFLRVKESMIPAETGPYTVTAGEMASVRAHYDNGMR